jgi:hypothetical protein
VTRLKNEEFCLLGYSVVYSVERQVTFRTNMTPQSALLATCFDAGFLLALFFDPEDGGDVFLRNVWWLSTDYAALYPRR